MGTWTIVVHEGDFGTCTASVRIDFWLRPAVLEVYSREPLRKTFKYAVRDISSITPTSHPAASDVKLLHFSKGFHVFGAIGALLQAADATRAGRTATRATFRCVFADGKSLVATTSDKNLKTLEAAIHVKT